MTHYPHKTNELDEDAISHIDAEDADDDDLLKKSPERVNLEKKFLSCYEAYLHPTEPVSAFRTQCLLDDLYQILLNLNRGWVNRKATRYRAVGFSAVDEEEALSIGCSHAYEVIKINQAEGKEISNPLAYYLKVAQYKTIDNYFRANFGRLPPRKKDENGKYLEIDPQEMAKHRKEAYTISLDQMQTDQNGLYRGDRNRILSTDPFASSRRPRWETDDKTGRLAMLYLSELMNYPYEPQKPLALMYGSVLFNLAKFRGGKDELSLAAKKSSKTNSPAWAHQKMGTQTLEALGEESARIVRQFYHSDLAWGQPFRENLQIPLADGTGRRCADIVYTQTYTSANTSNWIESIFESTMKKCAVRLAADPELRDYAEELLDPAAKVRKAMNKLKKKEASR